jgi:uncharacterized protein (TIGR02217 family)
MFLNIRLPDDISYGAVGGPEFSTNITTLNNSSEHRNINWEYPRHSYTIGYDVLNHSMVKSLLSFFYITRGKAHSFLFKDWIDFEANNQSISQLPVATGDKNDDGKIFQLSKNYSIQDISYIRPIKKPVLGTLKIFDKDSKILEENKDYKCDYRTGVIKFTNKIPSDYSTTFEFNLQTRFDQDHCEFTLEKIQLYSWKSIKIIEVLE